LINRVDCLFDLEAVSHLVDVHCRPTAWMSPPNEAAQPLLPPPTVQQAPATNFSRSSHRWGLSRVRARGRQAMSDLAPSLAAGGVLARLWLELRSKFAVVVGHLTCFLIAALLRSAPRSALLYGWLLPSTYTSLATEWCQCADAWTMDWLARALRSTTSAVKARHFKKCRGHI